MSVLLFGAHGQVGTELRRTLLPHGNLVSLTRKDVDLSDREAVRAAIERYQPRVIVNAAAYTAVDKAESEPELAAAINRDAVDEMARVAKASGALLVHYSTDYVFAGEGTKGHLPGDAPNPKGVYGQTKLAGEQSVQESGCDHLIFRTSWVYAGHGHNFVKTMLRLGQEKSELRVVADQIGAPTSAELIADVTSLAIAGFRKGTLESGLYHLAAGGETTWHGLATYVLEFAKAKGRALTVEPSSIEPIKTSEFPTPAKRPANSRLNCDSLEQALGIDLPDWRLHAARAVEQILNLEKGNG